MIGIRKEVRIKIAIEIRNTVVETKKKAENTVIKINTGIRIRTDIEIRIKKDPGTRIRKEATKTVTEVVMIKTEKAVVVTRKIDITPVIKAPTETKIIMIDINPR